MASSQWPRARSHARLFLAMITWLVLASSVAGLTRQTQWSIGDLFGLSEFSKHACTASERTQLVDMEQILASVARSSSSSSSTSSTSSPSSTSASSSKTTRDRFPLAVDMGEADFALVTRAIFCATNYNDEVADRADCAQVKPLDSHKSIFVHEAGEKIIIAFRLLVNVPERSRCDLRISVYERVLVQWSNIKKIVNKSTSELILAGYGTGGSAATIAAWMIINSLAPAYCNMERSRRNGNNQIKVITWNEVPMLTEAQLKQYPIYLQNHLRIVSKTDSPLLSSGSDVSPLGMPGIEFLIEPTSLFKDGARQFSETVVTNEKMLKTYYSRPIKKTSTIETEEYARARMIVSTELAESRSMAQQIPLAYKSYQGRLFMFDQNLCAAKMSHTLAVQLLKINAGDDSSVKCGVKSYSRKTGMFELDCNYYKDGSEKIINVARFEAAMGPFQDGSSCGTLAVASGKKAKKSSDSSSSSMEETRHKWSHCLRDLFAKNANSEIGWLTAFDERQRFCHFLPIPDVHKYIIGPIDRPAYGCYVSPVEPTESFREMSQNDPELFYGMFDLKSVSFPSSCSSVLTPIPLAMTDAQSFASVQQLAAQYLYELTLNTEQAKGGSIFNFRNTDSFTTVTLLQSNRRKKDKRHSFLRDFEAQMVRCLRKPLSGSGGEDTGALTNCNKPINLWIANSCPAACTDRAWFFCDHVLECAAAGFYISAVPTGWFGGYDLDVLHSQLQSKSDAGQVHALYKVISEKRGYGNLNLWKEFYIILLQM